MTPEERQMLEGLFDRVKQAANAPRDPEAEQLILQAVQAQPYAPYLLAQAVIIQDEGLKAAANRIQELEAELEQARAQAQRPSGGFLGGLFGGGAPAAPARSASGIPSFGGQQRAPFQQQPSGPWGGQQGAFGGRPGPFGGGQPGAGGSFLKGALATAAGVAGGALLFSGIQSMMQGAGDQVSALGGDVQNALGGAPVEPASTAAEEQGGYEQAAWDDPGADDMGGDLGGDDWA